jgi:hypothetical protein
MLKAVVQRGSAPRGLRLLALAGMRKIMRQVVTP